ncbi:endonuclease/exonuclease/phosphatase family protein [Candidatus Methanocrinis natronophilus]|uniref:Endonuclease/exonuclease/phosphatase family protein n=1 Tax=Candidatus Methanocrinis natronophilus TaxID=3033396 RepID=A0ABT5XAH9_9EURY|nr:endonuclease/exonuclease/phosphatase family protein [Candidatus Methanocrinis natronophilus]MDF0591697.1 endonuclease/exonuclease/phosphatase family protein [Candidatus Methanocrinis natronophilus]
MDRRSWGGDGGSRAVIAGEPSGSERQPPPFTVMTCNVGNGLARPDRLVPALRYSAADLVALQELELSQSEAIEMELSGEYPYRTLWPGGFEGRGLISRYPILSAERLQSSSSDLLCIIDLEGRDLTVISAHLPPPISFYGIGLDRRRAQIIEIIEAAKSRSPALILGDLNAVVWENPCSQLRSAGLIDAFREAGKGRGSTLPFRLGRWRRLRLVNRALMGIPLVPVVRVDYIWHTAEVRALEAWMGADTGSDHLPVMARLEIIDR